jgi:hypothetical protein
MLRYLRLAPAMLSVAALAWSASLQTPEQFAGFRIGTDKKLVRRGRVGTLEKRSSMPFRSVKES